MSRLVFFLTFGLLFLKAFILSAQTTAEPGQARSNMSIGTGGLEVFRFWEQIRNAGIALENFMQMGEEMCKSGKYEEALYWYQNALPQVLLLGKAKVDLYNDMAIIYEKKGNYSQAVQYYLKALSSVGYSISPDRSKAMLLTNISSSLIYVKDYERAITYINQALSIYTNDGNVEKIGIALATKARIYTETGNYEQAIAIYIEALSKTRWILNRQPGHSALVNLKGGILNNLADIYLKRKMPDSAFYYLEKIVPDLSRLPLYTRTAILVSYGEVFSQKNNYKAAALYVEKGLEVASEVGIQEIVIQAHRALSDLYRKQDLYQQAWEHERQYVKLNEELLAVEKLHQINKLENKYQLALKDREIIKKQFRIKDQENLLRTRKLWEYLLILGLSFSLITVLLLHRSYRNKKKLFREQLGSLEKDKKIIQVEATLKGVEKERARVAKELHDGVVSEVLAMKLNLITVEKDYSMLRHSDVYRNILYQSEEIARKLRNIAHNMMPVHLKQQGLYATIGTFLQRINSHNINFTFQHYGVLPVLKDNMEKIVLLTVLELIQNIIKHSKATEAIIQLNYFKELLSVTIEDNGVGIPEQTVSNSSSLRSLRENVEILGASMDIKSSEYTGTTVLIEIPVEGHIVDATDRETSGE